MSIRWNLFLTNVCHIKDISKKLYSDVNFFLCVKNDDANDGTDEDVEEIPSTSKRGFNKVYKVYKEFKTLPDLKAATEDLRNLGWIEVKIFRKQLLKFFLLGFCFV